MGGCTSNSQASSLQPIVQPQPQPQPIEDIMPSTYMVTFKLDRPSLVDAWSNFAAMVRAWPRAANAGKWQPLFFPGFWRPPAHPPRHFAIIRDMTLYIAPRGAV